MNTTRLIAALAITFAASGAALADGATYEAPLPATSTVSRAAVLADLAQARADGSLQATEADFYRAAPFVGQLTRAEVKAELMAAIANGDIQRLTREPMDFDVKAGRPSVTVRMAAR